MWPFNLMASGDNTVVCDPCATNICEEIRRKRGTQKSTDGCRVCVGSNVPMSSQMGSIGRCRACTGVSGTRADCEAELVSTWSTCTEKILPITLGKNTSKETPKFEPPPGTEDKLSVVGLLWAIRNELANFQESRGTGLEQYGFVDLLMDITCKITAVIIALCHLSQMCLKHFSHLFLELIWISLYIARFILDSILNIHLKETTRTKKLTMLTVFAIQVLGIIIVLEYTIGKVLVPIWVILSKMLSIVL